MRALWRTYSLPKRFAAIGAVVFVAAAALTAWLHLTASRAHMIDMAEDSNAALAAAFRNLLRDELDLLLGSPAPGPAQLAAFDRALRAAAAGTQVVKAKVYDARGRVAYSSDPRQIGRDESANPGVIGAMEGRRVSQLTRRDRFDGFHGALAERDLVASYLPLRDAEGRPAGAFELYADVTGWTRRLAAELAAQLAVLAAAFAAVYALLLGAVAAGSRTLAREHGESLRLAANVARAEAASRAKSEFLANMSHELRTPLNAVIGFAEIMKEGLLGPISPPAYREYARDIHASGMHLLGLVNDVLELARAEAGQATVSVEEVDLAQALGEALRMVHSRAEQAGIALRADFARGLAPLRTDGRKLRQIVINLLANAVKFTAQGSVTLSVREVERGKAVEIAVADTGIGIAPDDIAVCLAPFGQVDSSLSRRHDGSGLGLPLSAQLAERLGGRLELESELGVGTVARVTLPRRDLPPELRRAA